jgi:hypothetical protein
VTSRALVLTLPALVLLSQLVSSRQNVFKQTYIFRQ